MTISPEQFARHALLGIALLAGVACVGVAPEHPSTWRLVWRDADGRRYYADTSTVRRAGDSVSVVAWDLTPLASTGSRIAGLRMEHAHESIRIDCATQGMTGERVATVEGVRSSSPEREVVTFAGASRAGTPRAALASFLCAGARSP